MISFKPVFLRLVFAGLLACSSAASSQYLNWTTHQGVGANLGGWLVQESTIDTAWWAKYSGGASDEWGLCAYQGAKCGSVLEHRYATRITTADIDTLASAGVNTLRIPTTYAAWVNVPGSQLYHGNQTAFLSEIASYAIDKYDMHIIIDIHSLPGGVNGLPIGEASGNYGWFHNQTALKYSLNAVDAVINFIQSSASPQSYTLAPINEPADVEDVSLFGKPPCLSDSGAVYLGNYIKSVLKRVKAVNSQIPVMFQGSFKGESFWSGNFSSDTNLVFDVHNYYFESRYASSANLTEYICEDAISTPGDGKFPVFVGEWSIQAQLQNTFASREKNLQTGIAAWKKYAQGGSYWTTSFAGNATVDGEGAQKDYWDYETFIKLGYTNSYSMAVAC